MRAGRLRYVLVAALTSAAVLIGPGIGSASVSSPTVGDPAGSGPGSVLWASVHAGQGHAVAVDPRGGMVFAAGSTSLVAYDASTGAKLWDNAGGPGRSVAVTPDGHIVFVIKPLRIGGVSWDFSTAAFDTATGKRLWARRYNGRANGIDIPTALAVSHSGGTVFVTGTSKGVTSGRDYATVAYAAATGKQLWVSRYNGHDGSADIATAIAVNPRGGAVFVTGISVGRSTGLDFATIAYAAGTGATLWTKRYDNAHESDFASSVAASPDGHRVFVTGGSRGRNPGIDFATVAYAAATGATLWVRRYHAPSDRNNNPGEVLVSPRGGGTVIVSGDNNIGGNVSVAYSAATGRTMWVSRFHHDGFQQEFLAADAISPDGRSFYLTGAGFVVPGGEEPATAFTVAAKVATGAQSWAELTPPTSGADTFALSGAVSPDGGTVYVLVGGEFTAGSSAANFTTIAFRT
jgi:WD40 repeat protein